MLGPEEASDGVIPRTVELIFKEVEQLRGHGWELGPQRSADEPGAEVRGLGQHGGGLQRQRGGFGCQGLGTGVSTAHLGVAWVSGEPPRPEQAGEGSFSGVQVALSR